jgi:hypothetical protein
MKLGVANYSMAVSARNGNNLKTNICGEIILTGQLWTTSLIVHLWKSFFDIWDQQNKFVHCKDKSTRDAAKRVKVISQVKHLHTKKTEVLAAHQSIMFMTAHDRIDGQDKNALDACYLQTKTTKYLQNWVNTWKPAIEASIRSARALSVDTMGCIDDHFSYLVPPPKQPPRSLVPPNFHTRHDRNLASQRRRWKAPAFVRAITDHFSNVLQHMTANKQTTPAKNTNRPPSPA